MLGSRHGANALAEGIAALQRDLEVQVRGSREVSQWIGEPCRPVLVAGDFNLMVESPIFWTNWSQFTDAFSAVGFGLGHTFIGSHQFSVRIDHVLAGPGWRPRHCRVGPDVGAEHRPLIVDLVWEGPIPISPPRDPRPEPIEVRTKSEPSQLRRDFHDQLRRLLAAGGNRSAGPIRDLCDRAAQHGPRFAPGFLQESSAKLDRRALVKMLRSRQVSEAAILRVLSSWESRDIGRRNGPRNPDDALVRAARFLLHVPLD